MRFGFVHFGVVLAAFLVLCPLLYGQPTSETPTINGVNADDDARQLRIYRDALLQGSSQDVRVDAAVGLLLRKDSQSRQILLSALKSQDNSAAQEAVCKALIKSRGISQSIGAVDMFLEPLLDILQSPSAEQAELAAEAMLVFNYDAIADPLNRIVQDSNMDSETRIHAVYAIQLRPEPSALKTLIGLLDDPDAEVAGAAEHALQESFGIPVGTSRSEWATILKELQQKNPGEIRRERLLRQEIKLRQVQAESQRWQKLYLASLDKQYELLDDEGAAKMILEMMDSDLWPVRLWALGKIAGSPTIVNDAIKEKLLAFLWDDQKQVRLQTAKALKTMSAINPAPKLLERFSEEKDPEVALAIFEALGEACYFAFSPGAKIDLPVDIKDQTLQIASEYLKSSDPQPVLISAEVFRKLLELNDIEKSAMQAYLQQLQQRYMETVNQGSDNGLRADLLGILAHLCGQGGAKAAACELFEPLFVDALEVENDAPLRLAAATGIAYVDKNKALELFKKYQLQDVQSVTLRHIVIDVAGDAGDTTDLDWLLHILSDNSQSEAAWDAIRRICQRQDAAFLMAFLPTLQSAPGAKDEYVRDILTIAEQKAAAGQQTRLLNEIQQRTIGWMAEHRMWDQAVSYLGTLKQPASAYSNETQLLIMKIYLYGNQPAPLTDQLKAKLNTGVMQKDGPELKLLRAYFNSPDVPAETKGATLSSLRTLAVPDRPNWSAFVQEINLLLNPPADTTPAASPVTDTNTPTPAVPAPQQ